MKQAVIIESGRVRTVDYLFPAGPDEYTRLAAEPAELRLQAKMPDGSVSTTSVTVVAEVGRDGSTTVRVWTDPHVTVETERYREERQRRDMELRNEAAGLRNALRDAIGDLRRSVQMAFTRVENTEPRSPSDDLNHRLAKGLYRGWDLARRVVEDRAKVAMRIEPWEPARQSDPKPTVDGS
jgi:hypothetical protein